MKTCAFVWVYCIVLIALGMVFCYAQVMFWYPSSLTNIWILLLGFYTHDPTMFLPMCPLKSTVCGVKEPYVYMQSRGLNLKGCMWWYLARRMYYIGYFF